MLSMEPWKPDRAKAVSDLLLSGIRNNLRAAGLSFDRLPPFLTASAARTGWTGDVLIAVFDDAPNEVTEMRGALQSDMSILAEVADAHPVRAVFSKVFRRNVLQQWPRMSPFIQVFTLGTAFTTSFQWGDEGSLLLLDLSFEQEDS